MSLEGEIFGGKDNMGHDVIKGTACNVEVGTNGACNVEVGTNGAWNVEVGTNGACNVEVGTNGACNVEDSDEISDETINIGDVKITSDEMAFNVGDIEMICEVKRVCSVEMTCKVRLSLAVKLANNE